MMQPISREEVLNIVRNRSPIIPNEIKKVLKQGDTMLLGAMLSELASKGLVKVSNTKMGGSPFYYDPTKPETLERAADYLNEKDRRTFQLLKEKKVLRDSNQEALIRVSLRNIKDFARLLNVSTTQGEMIFWKYYLVSDEEAEQLIGKQLQATMPKKPEIEEIEQKPISEAPAPKEAQNTTPLAEPPQPKAEQSIAPPQVPKEEIKQELKVETPTQNESKSQQTLSEDVNDDFFASVKKFLDENKIKIKEQKILRKNSEIDLIILMPTPVGDVEYFCKAKSKKRSNDGDLASAKLEGQAKNLPVLYLTTGEITKKGKDMLESTFKGLVVKEI